MSGDDPTRRPVSVGGLRAPQSQKFLQRRPLFRLLQDSLVKVQKSRYIIVLSSLGMFVNPKVTHMIIEK